MVDYTVKIEVTHEDMASDQNQAPDAGIQGVRGYRCDLVWTW